MKKYTKIDTIFERNLNGTKKLTKENSGIKQLNF